MVTPIADCQHESFTLQLSQLLKPNIFQISFFSVELFDSHFEGKALVADDSTVNAI